MTVVLVIYSIILCTMYIVLRKNIKDITDVKNCLKESNDKLQLILNSTAEAIYGLDMDGNCTFCNTSCLEILGYNHEDELLGKNMHQLIHYSYKDLTPMSSDECRIFNSMRTGKGSHVDDEVFWTAEGGAIDVEYWSYPQFRDGKVIGGVVTFVNITERKKADEEIRYLSYHDALTGLYNRMFFEAELKRLDTERNYPISIIVGDANGLKLTNDIFGHAAGDELLKKVANAFKKACRADDIIARTGGDEFIVLLPKTDASDAEGIIERIKNEISKEKIIALKPSISMGTSTKTNSSQDIEVIIGDAENLMYWEKTLDRKDISNNIIEDLIESLHKKHKREELHSKNVSQLSQDIGRAMKLSNEEIKRLEEAGYYHDIGKIVLSDKTIKNNASLNEKEIREYKQHSIVGYRILNSFDETLDLAGPVLAHHERWNGTGFPKGLKGSEIPLIARIIAVAESYDAMTNEMNDSIKTKEFAIEEIKRKSGVTFDPDIVDVFVGLMQTEK